MCASESARSRSALVNARCCRMLIAHQTGINGSDPSWSTNNNHDRGSAAMNRKATAMAIISTKTVHTRIRLARREPWRMAVKS